MMDSIARPSSALPSLHTRQQALSWTRKQGNRRVRNSTLHISCATQSGGSQPSGGTRYIGGKKVKVLRVGDSGASLRDKVIGEPAPVKLLTRVQQLRLLTKAEKAGLLSAAERAGLSLSTIEKLGLLSKAEELGILSAATDPRTPGSLLSLALVLLLAGPVFVYYVPEDALWEVVLQILVAFLMVTGGSAAFAASKFVSSLQKSD
eukprot:c25705_g1_i1 orf=94-708(+)